MDMSTAYAIGLMSALCWLTLHSVNVAFLQFSHSLRTTPTNQCLIVEIFYFVILWAHGKSEKVNYILYITEATTNTKNMEWWL